MMGEQTELLEQIAETLKAIELKTDKQIILGKALLDKLDKL